MPMQPTPTVQINLRLPPDVVRRAKRYAKRQKTSLAAYVLAAIVAAEPKKEPTA